MVMYIQWIILCSFEVKKKQKKKKQNKTKQNKKKKKKKKKTKNKKQKTHSLSPRLHYQSSISR